MMTSGKVESFPSVSRSMLSLVRWVSTNLDWVSSAHVGVVGSNYGGR